MSWESIQNNKVYIVKAIQITLAASIGAFLGMTIAMAVVSGFAAMILVPVFNVYYAAIFFFVRSVYSYKIIKKNQIQLDGLPYQFPSKKARHDRFNKGASSDYQNERHSDSSTGGSTSADEPTIFRRAPLITETQALYQQSYILSDECNNKINKINSIIEIILTLSIFISSFLILTMERDWWGLGPEDGDQFARNWNDWRDQGKMITKANSAYAVRNTIRLVIVGCSISFFMVIVFIEIT